MWSQSRKRHLAVYFTAVLVCCVCADEEEEAVKAKEGTNVTLKTRKAICDNNDAQVLWTFGPEQPNMRIANVKERTVESNYADSFRDRLELDSQTGALTITQLRVSDSGFYMCQSIGTNIFSQCFHLTVYRSLRPPFIKVNTSSVTTNCNSVTVECSLENSKELNLSWFRGTDRLKTSSSLKLSSMLSLVLDIECPVGDDYSCVAENPVDEKTTKLKTEETCLRDRETLSWCHTEATVRLVVSAVVGLVLIILVADHVRHRR